MGYQGLDYNERTGDVLKKQKSMTRKFKREDIPLYIMALPGVALLILFSYLPMGGLVLAFKKYKLLHQQMGGVQQFQVPLCHIGCLHHYKEHGAL